MSRNNNYMNMHFEGDNQPRYSEVDIFSTQGRLGRKRYFLYSIVIPFVFFWSFASIAGILTHLGSVASLAAYAFLGFATTAMFFILIRLTIQRCHDFNKSGWLAVFALIPFANLVFAMIPGNNGLNQYGEAPEPANGFIKVAFYALVALLIGVAVAVLVQLFNSNFNDWFVF